MRSRILLTGLSVALLAGAGAASAVADTPRPIAAYSFDEGAGSTASDSAGDHDGTIDGASWVEAGKFGAALDFDGTDDLVSVADDLDLDLTGDFSLEAWVRPDALATFDSPISKVEVIEEDLSGYILTVKGGGGKPGGYISDASGGGATVLGKAALPTGEWSHLALTSDEEELRLYVDGVLEATVASDQPGATGSELEIGHTEVFDAYFDGLIDEVRVYDEALSQGEVESTAANLGGEFSTDPALFPSFDPAVTDYAVRCDGEEPVAVSAAAASGTTIAVDGQSPQGGEFSAEVELEPNQAFEVAIERGSEERVYHVRCLPLDFPTWDYDRFAQPHHELYVVTPTLGSSPAQLVVIFDDHGVPVWWYRSELGAIDAKVLDSGVIAYSTFFPGAFGNDPASAYYFRDLDGSLVEDYESEDGPGTLKTVGGPTDQHELQELPNGNFLVISYQVREHVDLSEFCAEANPTNCGTADDEIYDGVIQEISPSGELVWSWSSLDNLGLDEVAPHWIGRILSQSAPYDVFHLNAVEPDGEDMLISPFRADAVYKIDRAEGGVEWKLGGVETAKSLELSGDPESYPLEAQHDVRRLADGTVTVHDNKVPRAVRYQVDPEAMTATLLEEVVDPEEPAASCCGSARRSEDGSWLISWGGNPLVTEFGADEARTFLLDLGEVASYRVVAAPEGVLEIADLRAGMSAMHPG